MSFHHGEDDTNAPPQHAKEPMPGGSTDHIAIYEGPVKVDFMYLKECDFKPVSKWIGCVVLKDASGRVGAVVARSERLAAAPPTPEELLELNRKI